MVSNVMKYSERAIEIGAGAKIDSAAVSENSKALSTTNLDVMN